MGSDSAPINPRERITILPLRNAVLFPMSVVPINVGRPRSVRVVEDLVGQERALARVVKVIRLGPGNYSVVLNGLGRFRILRPLGLEPYMRAEVERIRDGRTS